MTARTALLVSWFWLAGRVLLAEAHALFDVDISDADLQRRFFDELQRLPARRQQRLHGFAYTEDGIEAATPEQLAILARTMRRVITTLTREMRLRRLHREEAAP